MPRGSNDAIEGSWPVHVSLGIACWLVDGTYRRMNLHGLQDVRDYKVIKSAPSSRGNRSWGKRRLAVQALDRIDVVQPLCFGEL